jgi:hypothetical protein
MKKTRQMYEQQLKAEFDYNSGIYAAFRDGKLEGELTKALETASRMREKGFSKSEILEISGLSANVNLMVLYTDGFMEFYRCLIQKHSQVYSYSSASLN